MPYKNLTQDPTLPQGFNAHFRQRFWRKVNKTETCWLWTGTPDRNGYGFIPKGDNRNVFAHRASWILHNGAIPDGLHVLHRCDTPLCVNPGHLFLGTQQDNMADMVAKGRVFKGDRPASCGERNPLARLTWEKVRAIRRIHAAGGVSKYRLGKMFNTTKQNVMHIIAGRSWKPHTMNRQSAGNSL